MWEKISILRRDMEGFVFKTEIKLSQMGNVLDRADRLVHACEADR